MAVTLQDVYVVAATLRHETFGVLAFKTKPSLELLLINHSAMDVLSCCDGKNTVEQVIDAISMKYRGVDKTRIQRDICMLLSDFLERGIITCCQPVITQ